MLQHVITTAPDLPASAHGGGAEQPVPADLETFSFVDVEHGDPDGTDIDAAVASWDGFV